MNVSSKNIFDSILKKANPVKNINSDLKFIPPNKKELWGAFKFYFQELYGKEFIENEDSIGNIKVLFYYYLKDQDFFQCKNLKGEISRPSFDKGLLVIGGYGIGKTAYMKVFEKCFEQYSPYRFKIYNVNDVVTLFEGCNNFNDKNQFFDEMSSGKILFDDVNSEREASNFGKVDLLKELIEKRYMKDRLTHITCNYKEGYEGDVERVLLGFAERYGGRVYDRIFGMFNIITFSGKSLRR